MCYACSEKLRFSIRSYPLPSVLVHHSCTWLISKGPLRSRCRRKTRARKLRESSAKGCYEGNQISIGFEHRSNAVLAFSSIRVRNVLASSKSIHLTVLLHCFEEPDRGCPIQRHPQNYPLKGFVQTPPKATSQTLEMFTLSALGDREQSKKEPSLNPKQHRSFEACPRIRVPFFA